MSYLESRRAVARARHRITNGSVPSNLRRLCLCDDCRYPFDAPYSGIAIPLCRECRTERLEKGRAALALTLIARGRHLATLAIALTRCPDRLARIEKYAARAALNHPIFDEDPNE